MSSSPSDSTIFWVTFTSLVLYTSAGNKGTGIDGLKVPYGSVKSVIPMSSLSSLAQNLRVKEKAKLR